jgi:hypothetical protein
MVIIVLIALGNWLTGGKNISIESTTLILLRMLRIRIGDGLWL